MFWHGRAWFYGHRESRVEWLFGKRANSFHIGLCSREGESGNGIQLIFCLPWIVGFYFSIAGAMKRGKPTELGISIHDNTIHFYTFSYRDEYNSRDPWWRKGWCWTFPWAYDWHSTEILSHNSDYLARVIHTEKRHVGLKDFCDTYEDMRKLKVTVSETYDYKYTLKNGEVQHRKATVFVERRTWRMRWWPLLPFKKVSTSIDVAFDSEVGDRSGSWKGGCTGCGYEMKHGETPLECLRRMERERTFR